MKTLSFFLLCIIQTASVALAQSPLKSLTVGNKFIYYNLQPSYKAGDQNRYIETVLRDTVLNGKRYAILYSTFDNSIRFERSDENAVYVVRNGREELAHSWEFKNGDSIRTHFFGMGCDTCRFPIKYVEKFPDRYNKADTILSFSIIRPITVVVVPLLFEELPIFMSYEKKKGVTDMQIGFMGDRTGWRKVYLQGAVLDGVGLGDTTSRIITVGVNDALPTATAFTSKAPNPFSESISLDFSLESAAQVELLVTAFDGRRVASFPLGQRAAGKHFFSWNGKTANGEDAATGAYMVSLVVNGQRKDDVKVSKVK